MTRSRQFLRLFQSSVPLAFTGEGESQTHEPHYEGSLLEFHSYTDPPLPIYHPARACVRVCAEQAATNSGGDKDPSADLAFFLSRPRNRFSFSFPRVTLVPRRGTHSTRPGEQR